MANIVNVNLPKSMYSFKSQTTPEPKPRAIDYCVYFSIILLKSIRSTYLEELDRETEEPEGLCLRRPRGGDPRPGRLRGDLDRRQGSFHSSGRLITGAISFFKGGSMGLLRGLKTQFMVWKTHMIDNRFWWWQIN